MKVGLVTPQYAPQFEGGTESVVRAQARELAALGHAVRIVSGTDRLHAGQDLLATEVDGLPVRFVPRTPDEPYDLALERPRVLALVLELLSDVDVVHLHHWSTLDGGLVRRLAPRVPVVVTLHDLFTTCPRFFRVPFGLVESCPPPGSFETCVVCLTPDAPGVAPELLHTGLAARMASFAAELEAAALVLTPSRSHQQNLAPHLAVDARWRVLPHGLGRELGARASAAWDGTGELRLVYLGHRTAVKGIRDLALALGGLPPELESRVRLDAFGDELDPGLDAELTRCAGAARLRFHAPYGPAELGQLLRAEGPFHLAAAPSRVAESYGLVVDEALALGLPTWVSDRGAPQERIGAAGLVLPAEDPAAWTRAFATIFAHPERLEVQRGAAAATVRTARDAARELSQLYQSLLHSA